jgi:hypothetical protein
MPMYLAEAGLGNLSPESCPNNFDQGRTSFLAGVEVA